MWLWISAIVVAVLLILISRAIFRYLNREFYILALCRRIKAADGTELSQKICTIPGTSIFGNNLDLLHNVSHMEYLRKNNQIAGGRSYLLHFMWCPCYNITNAEEAMNLFQSPDLITKNVVYVLLQPFLGTGLLTSTDAKWHFRRKMLTPAFHFNILQTFLDIFKEQSAQFIANVNQHIGENLILAEYIPEFTLNSICETALGVKLNDVPGSQEYRRAIHRIEAVIVERLANPLLYFNTIFSIFGRSKFLKDSLKVAHDFSSKVIQKKRQDYKQTSMSEQTPDEFGKKKRYAMLDTLLDAEQRGDIDHEGICEEVNTFMFEGYDTTSACLTFSLLNLANHPDVQEKCFQELMDLPDIADITIFDFNQLEYLECVIKETLRLYPSVPFIARQSTHETLLNGLVLPPNTAINVHIFDIMHDPTHFPEPYHFDPTRFFPENTTNRHPFAFVAFSAGQRNCIGQKFAMLEIKVLLASILKRFHVLPVTRIEDLNLEYGIILRILTPVQIKLMPRK